MIEVSLDTHSSIGKRFRMLEVIGAKRVYRGDKEQVLLSASPLTD